MDPKTHQLGGLECRDKPGLAVDAQLETSFKQQQQNAIEKSPNNQKSSKRLAEIKHKFWT